MKFKKSLLGTMISMAVTTSVLSTGAIANNVVSVSDLSQLKAAEAYTSNKKASANYIVQLKGASGIGKADELGELLPSNQRVALGNNNYNADSSNISAYTARLKAKQAEMVANFTSGKLLHSYVHTFNGFSAVMSSSQAEALRNHPDVVGVWEDEIHVPQTSNTPAFLGLAGPDGGLHVDGIDGEGVIVGILDTGIIPEHPSFADDGSYSDPADLGWAGECVTGEEAEEETFSCNNKLIGARFYDAGFGTDRIRYDLGEFDSPRDADSHGSHTASTAAGNAGVAASRSGVEIGTISGIAPRARVAAYKVCWNSNFEDPATPGSDRGCSFADSMAAIDDAIADGVDVLNYSIGNSANLNTPVYNASLRATQAGVFFASSAGNDGPGPSTVSNIAPWQTTVAASTYDGIVPQIGEAIIVTSDGEEIDPAFSIEGGITAPPAEGVTGNVVAIEPALACDSGGPVTNPEAIAGNIALIARGACNFSEKILAAQGAGATAAIVYSDARAPISMGGDGTGITIPGRMIENAYGLDLASRLEEGLEITATWSNDPVAIESVSVGNVMAGFSSRGPNTTPLDIIKPDITAPGVTILAAISPTQFNFGGNEQGQNFGYISGTSMSGPHIAGMAALLKGENDDWSPAQIKSAIMTSARQDLTKEDGTTPADPFDFGAGHTDPLASLTPGLTYEANVNDYLGFLCGQGQATLVASFGAGEQDCTSLTADGFATDPSQLNYPSIGISELDAPEEISRTVTDMTGAGGSYTVSVDAPTGIDVEVKTFDADGVETESENLVVEADGKASYSLTFSKGEGFVPNEFVFGAVTFTSADGTEVRSPIAVNPLPSVKIDVPAELSLTLNRGRASFPVEMRYNGSTSMDYAGLVAPEFLSGSVVDANQAGFDFNTAIGLGQFFLIPMPEGTQVARFNLFDSFVSSPGTDLDLHVWECLNGLACRSVASSETASSNEEVILVNPDPRDGVGINVYVVLVHGWDLGNDEEGNNIDSVNFNAPMWRATPGQSSTRMFSSRRARDGRFNNVIISTRGLAPNLYMGAVTFYNDEGVAEGTTVLEVFN